MLPIFLTFSAILTKEQQHQEQYCSHPVAPRAALIEEARAGKLTSWTNTPNGTLALLILLDQLPRNIYRGSLQAYSGDQALAVALNAVVKGLDRHAPLDRQMFFYLPIMHHESLLAQVACLGLYQSMVARAQEGPDLHDPIKGALDMAQVHADIISQFGRFPGRSESLGRHSTLEELKFLQDEGPRGF